MTKFPVQEQPVEMWIDNCETLPDHLQPDLRVDETVIAATGSEEET